MLRSSLALLTVGAASLLLPGLALGADKPHPHIHKAIYELRQARGELNKAAHDFGGHRKAAISAIDAAIGQLEKALKFSGDKRPFKGDPKADYYKKYKTYPHIRHAIVELRETATELKEASHNYGGHRKAALADTRAAIKQLQMCVKFAREKK